MALKLRGSGRMAETLAAIKTWRRNPSSRPPCPLCDAPGLDIADRSARPHAEWYAVACASCGLDDVVHIALGAAPPGPPIE